MFVQQLYTACLAEAAYYIESNGEAAIIDPLRESQPYLELAKQRGARIKYVMETHFHADFVSGHLDLAKKTGATIVFGPSATPNYAAHVAEDGEELQLGDVRIKVLHTPGHTMESSTYLLLDESGNPNALFTGDTLFIGDVGRPDLAVKTDLSEADLAGHLFESLRNKIMPLPDEVIVYPGHGPGSACGKMMSAETEDTLGHQKQVNYALRADMSKEEFVAAVLDGLAPPPQYFPKNAVINKMGYESVDAVMAKGLSALPPADFEKLARDEKTLVLDTRHQNDFVKGFIPGSLFVGIDDNFAPWVGTLVTDLQQPILIVADPGREEEVVLRLARVGYDNPLGYLAGGFESWKKAGKPWEVIEEVSAQELATLIPETPAIRVLDVRRKSEYDGEHILGFENFPLDFIQENWKNLNKNQLYYLHCAGGYRSAIAASILHSNGFQQLVNVQGGYQALQETQLPRTEFVQPTTML